MSVLQALLESRDAAHKAYEAFVTPLIEAGAELTPEQAAERISLRAKVEAVDVRIDEVHAEEKRSAALAEVRKGIGTGTPAPAQVNEPTTYGPDSPHSYYADMARSYSPSFRGHYEAVARLNRATHEAAVEMVNTPSPEKRRQLERIIREENRDNSDGAQRALDNFRNMGRTGRSELRTGMDTTSGSGGSFATPVYFVQNYAPYRQPGRPFIDQCNKQELPPYGMTVYLPHVTGAAGVASQSENTAAQETDPTAGYLSANLTTEAGQVTISQQLLDRAGPGFDFDKLVFDQLNRAYAPVVDLFVLNAALSGAGNIAYTDSTGFHLNVASGVGGFLSKVAGAKSAVRKAAGVVMSATHLFLAEDRWEYIEAWGDGQGRPVVVPGYANPMNAVAAGSMEGDAGTVEGATGYKMAGLPVFTDLSIPTPTVGNDQAIVGNLDEVYVYEGTPVTRVLPQTLGNQLSVILQQYSYIAAIARYPHAVYTVTGTGMSTITF